MRFNYQLKEQPNGRSCWGWPKNTTGSADLLRLVNAVELPISQAEMSFDCTVEAVQAFDGLFKLAMLCEPAHQQPIGIFETEKGKQGFLMFNSGKKGIKLTVNYGENGWEAEHEQLRRNNGRLDP